MCTYIYAYTYIYIYILLLLYHLVAASLVHLKTVEAA